MVRDVKFVEIGESCLFCDPQDMQPQIIEEARRYLGETKLPKNAPISVGSCGGGAVYVVEKRVMKDCGEKNAGTRITVLAGSPLYIALKLKRYDEAEKILEEYPRAAEPGFAAVPVEVHFQKNKKKPELKFLFEKGIYLEDLVLLDKEMPEGLFRKLFEKLIRRAEHNELESPGRHGCHIQKLGKGFGVPIGNYQNAELGWYSPKFGFQTQIPVQIMELPMWCDMRKALNCGKLKDEDRLQDLELFWQSLEGICRLKKLDAAMYERYMSERVAAHLIVRFMYLTFSMLEEQAAKGKRSGAKEDCPEHIREIRIPTNGKQQIDKLRTMFEKLGLGRISADELWDACMDYGCGYTEDGNSFWVAFEIWKDLYGEKLIFTVDEEQEPYDPYIWSLIASGSRGIELLRALLNHRESVCCMENGELLEYDGTKESIDAAKAFLELVDRVEWRHRKEADQEHWELFLQYRRAMEKAVLRNGDTELLLMCLGKNIFPMADIDFLREIYEQDEQFKEKYRNLLSLLVMKKHGCLDTCAPTSVSQVEIRQNQSRRRT